MSGLVVIYFLIFNDKGKNVYFTIESHISILLIISTIVNLSFIEISFTNKTKNTLCTNIISEIFNRVSMSNLYSSCAFYSLSILNVL